MLILDMDAYAEKYGEKDVRKNCTIPAWLNELAEKEHITFLPCSEKLLKNV